MRTTHALLTAALLGAASPAQAQRHDPNVARYADQNAALDYLREAIFMDGTLKEAVDDSKDAFSGIEATLSASLLEPETRERIIESRDLIARLHKASKLPDCDFGLNREEGLNILLPHLQHMRDFGRLLRADAIILIDEGEVDAAVENISSLLRIANQLSESDPFLITNLIAVAEFALAKQILEAIPSSQLSSHHRAQLRQTLRTFNADDPFNMHQTVRSEVKLVSTWIRNSAKGVSDDHHITFINGLFQTFYGDTPPSEQDLEALSDHTQFMSYVDVYAALEGEIDKRWNSTNPGEQLRELDTLIANGSFGPLAKHVTTGMARMYEIKQQHEELYEDIADLINK